MSSQPPAPSSTPQSKGKGKAPPAVSADPTAPLSVLPRHMRRTSDSEVAPPASTASSLSGQIPLDLTIGLRSNPPQSQTPVAPSQGAPAPAAGSSSAVGLDLPPRRSARLASEEIDPAGIAVLSGGSTPVPASPRSPVALDVEDVVMDVSSEEAVAEALRACVGLTSSREALAVKHGELKAKIDSATSDAAIVQVFHQDWRAEVRDFVFKYRDQVDRLAASRSALARLRKHKANKSFPTALNRINIPVIQFAQAFAESPISAGFRGNYVGGGGTGTLETVNRLRVVALKEQVLKDWISEKEREIRFLERGGSAVDALSRYEEVMKDRGMSLKARYDYLSGRSRYRELVRDIEFQLVLFLSLASTVVGRINQLVNHEEDKKLAASLKKMAVDTPAVAAASTAPPNDLSELKKMVVDLHKKVDLNSKKVSDALYCLVLSSVGLLSLTPDLFQRALLDCIEAGWEEIREEERQGEGEVSRHRRQEKRKKGEGGRGRQSRRRGGPQSRWENHQRRREWVRLPEEGAEQAQRKEERWQEVAAAFSINGLDADSGFGLYDFSEFYGLSWMFLFGPGHFLTHAYPPHILLNNRLVRFVSVCCFVYECTITVPKINIFDATTYPDIVTSIDYDLAFMVLSRFAPEWLLGSKRFTNHLHSNLNIEIPDNVSGSLSAGAKYISPISINKSLVMECWDDFHTRALRSWDRTKDQLYADNEYVDSDPELEDYNYDYIINNKTN